MNGATEHTTSDNRTIASRPQPKIIRKKKRKNSFFNSAIAFELWAIGALLVTVYVNAAFNIF